MTNNEELENRLQAQIDKIEEVIDKTRRDEIVDISDMNQQVNDICQNIVKLESRTARHMETKMSEMIGSLEILEKELKAFQERIRKEEENK